MLKINISTCVCRDHLDLLVPVERMVETDNRDPLDHPDLAVVVERPAPL